MPHNLTGIVMRGLISGFLPLIFTASAADMALGGEKEDMEAMQKALNQQVLERPFNPGDKAAIDAYLEQALRKGLKPSEERPKDWGPGYTCDRLVYSLYQYRNCLHYYRYYGRYYPY